MDVFADIGLVDVECKAREDLEVVICLPVMATGIAVGTTSFSVMFLDGDDWEEVVPTTLSAYGLILNKEEKLIYNFLTCIGVIYIS